MELKITREALIDVKSVTINMSQPILQANCWIIDKDTGNKIDETLIRNFEPSKQLLNLLREEILLSIKEPK